MKIVGHGLREHIRFLRPLFGLLFVVFLLRLILGAAGAPLWLTRLFSVTGAAPGAVLIAVLMIHARRFGSYTNVVVASLLLNCCGQLLIILAIIFSVLTGISNIFMRPEFSMRGDDPHHWLHIYWHLTFGIGLFTLLGAGMGCLLLWILRLLVPVQSNPLTGRGN